MLKLEKIYFYLGKKCILNDLNMNVEEGNIYGFLGANGSGKTTTIRIISEVFKPNIGKIIKNSKIQDKKKIGYLFHRDSLYESLSALDNLELFAKLYNINNKDQKISQLLKEVKLFDVKNDKVSTFSQGMKKRLSLSRVFLNNPYLAVLDEPFSGLDIEAKEWLINYRFSSKKCG
jgi:ABC-type multidrug transport system ATPase subunit